MHALIMLIVVLAVIGIAWWAISQIPLPPPLRIVAVVVVALIAIVALMDFAGAGLAFR